MAAEVYEGWAVIELMGRRKLGGYVRDVELFGVPVIRVDVPEVGGGTAATQYYAPSALYALTPTTEEIARGLAERNRPEPVTVWELPAPRPTPRPRAPLRYEGDDDEDREDE
jgi:hypothetical protein